MLLTTWVRPNVCTMTKRAPTVIMPLLAKLKEKSDQARMQIGNKETGF